ncbi:MAG TPA: BlaI/MecI/CopY family transcriptional regulator [Longimicrobiales bacterium]
MIGDLSRRERQIMDALFRRGEATVAEVMEEMPDPPSYSAVRATLRILEEKGHVVHRQDGPRYVYLPAVAPEEAQEDALRHVVRTFFHGSAENAAVALLRMSDAELTDEDIDRLARKIRDAAREGR